MAQFKKKWENLYSIQKLKYYLKLDDWSCENEWRLLFQNPTTIKNKHYYDANNIEEISIGYKGYDSK